MYTRLVLSASLNSFDFLSVYLGCISIGAPGYQEVSIISNWADYLKTLVLIFMRREFI